MCCGTKRASHDAKRSDVAATVIQLTDMMGNHDNAEGHCYGFDDLNVDSTEQDLQESEPTSPDPNKKGCNFFGRCFMKDLFSSWYRPKWLPGILRRRREDDEEDDADHHYGNSSSCVNCLHNNFNNPPSVLDNNTCDSHSSVDGATSGQGSSPKLLHHHHRQHDSIQQSSQQVVTRAVISNCYHRHHCKDSNCNYSNNGKSYVGDKGYVTNKATQTRHTVTWMCSECVSYCIH